MSFCTQFCAEIARQLAPRIRPRYLALSDERTVTAIPEITDNGHRPPIPEKIPHVTIEIRSAETRQLVTAIEMLTTTNKGNGRQEYLARRDKYLSGTAHLLELDFLRCGPRLLSERSLPDASYFALLSRSDRRLQTQVWRIQLRDRLPVIPVPLLPEDAEVSLNLQSIFETLWDIFSYDLLIDYQKAPRVPFNDDDDRWADQLLRDAGLRK